MFLFLLDGFAAVCTPYNLLLVLIGVAVGIIFGSIPGLSANMAVALCLPMTYGMQSISGIVLLVSLYIGAISGGLLSAILLNIPGTPSSIATCFDGHPMAARGEAGRALGVGILYSFIGGLLSFVILIGVAGKIANVALKFGPFEYCAIGLFSLTMVASLISGSVVKGLISCLLGLCFATVGSAPIDGFPRFTFGFYGLSAGFNLLSVLIGLFAISEVLKTAAASKFEKESKTMSYKVKGFGISWEEFKGQIGNLVRSSAIGLGIGVLPGIGGGTSNLLAYSAAKNRSKYPEKFGTGIIDGIVASEASNNASIGGALIPLLALGIPGDGVTAMLLGGLTIHGITPGPLLFVNNTKFVYAIFAALLLANIAMVIMELLGLPVFVRLLQIPKRLLLPVILVLCMVGAYGLNNRIFDIWAMFAFGIIGYLLEKYKFSTAPIILGFVLGPTIEQNLRRGLMASQGSMMPFITSPISCVFLIATLVSVALAVRKQMIMNHKTV